MYLINPKKQKPEVGIYGTEIFERFRKNLEKGFFFFKWIAVNLILFFYLFLFCNR